MRALVADSCFLIVAPLPSSLGSVPVVRGAHNPEVGNAVKLELLELVVDGLLVVVPRVSVSMVALWKENP